MPKTTLRIPLFVLAATGVACGGGDPSLSEPEPEYVAEAATLATQSPAIDATDCMPGTIEWCPGTTNLVKGCTLDSRGELGVPSEASTHRAPVWRIGAGTNWFYVKCTNGSRIDMYCQGPFMQTLEACDGPAGSVPRFSFSVGQAGGFSFAGAVAGHRELHSTGIIASYQLGAGNTADRSRQQVDMRCGPAGTTELDAQGYVQACTLAPANINGPNGATLTQGGGTFTCPPGARVQFGANGFASRCDAPFTFTVRGRVIQFRSPPEFNDNGFLRPATARLMGSAALETRRSGVVTCAANSPVAFDGEGYLLQCNLAAGTSATLLAGSAARLPVSCQGSFELTTAGYLSSCTLASALASSLPAIGGAAPANLTCQAGAPAEFYPANGLVQRCTPSTNVGVRIGDGPPAKSAVCARDAVLTLSAAARLSSCTFGARFRTEGYASGGAQRVCPAGSVPTFTNVGGRDIVTSVAASAGAASTPINGANTVCKLDVGAACTTGAQCDSGTCATVCR